MAQSNPYLDPILMKGLQQFCPTQNEQFVSAHKGYQYEDNNQIMVGNEIVFDSDPDDDDELHVYKGEIKRYDPKHKTIAIQLRINGAITTYFIDEIEIKSITSKQSASNKGLMRTSSVEQCAAFDLSVFKDKHDNKCRYSTTDIITNCIKLKRLVSGLQYYSFLDVLLNEMDQDIFANFIDNIYTEFIDDYNHLHEIHQDQLHEITEIIIENEMLPPCKINACLFTARHHEADNDKKSEIKSTLHPSLNVYKETMDSLHFYLFHQFECGLMTLKTVDYAPDIKIDDDDDDDDNKDEYYDHEIYKIQTNIDTTKNNTKDFSRYNDGTSNKFTIKMDDEHDIINSSDAAGDIDQYVTPIGAEKTTFIDEIKKYLEEIHADCCAISNFTAFIQTEEYDTDAVISDIDFVVDGNIAHQMNEKKALSSTKQFIRNIQLQSASFSIGLIFYYWPYYKYFDEIESFDEENVNDHGGHAVKDLYIEKKYSSFKQEISNYKFIEFECYQDSIIRKAELYLKSKTARQLKADLYGHVVHYGIKQDAAISFANIVSLILYCDYSQHCTDFSATFRKQTPFESLESLKKRNQNYWWMSKILRETVEIYGQCRDGIWDGIHSPKYDPKNRINKLIGPFYTGLSVEMIVPEFNIRLCSPTSTSKKLEIAIKFSGDIGMVIQLNNPAFGGYELGKAFNCAWISRYKEEDERLFFGGSWRTKIEAIRMIRTRKNFANFFRCLTYFDGMVNGTVMDKEIIKKRDRKIIEKLINWRLMKEDDDDSKLDPYLYQTFDCFCRHKIQIVLSLETLQVHCDEKLRNIIMHPIIWNNRKYNDNNNNNLNVTNLFRKVLFEIFPNLSSIIIYSAPRSYAFSLLHLLSLIQLSSSLNQIKIKAEQYEGNNGFEKSWLWISTTSFVINQYQNKGYQISFDTKKCIISGEALEAVDILWIKKK